MRTSVAGLNLVMTTLGLNSKSDVHKRCRLLIVDDKPDNLVALEAVLNDEYDLISANSGAEALEELEKHDVDVILLDIQMPHMDGYETARRIKQIDRLKNIPIIFVTAIFTDNPYIRKGYEAGAVDYFTKPFDPDILRLKVKIYASFRQRDVLLKERERRIKESEELLKAGRKLSAILETLPVGVIIADKEGGIVQTNDAVLKMWKSFEPFENDAYGMFLQWWSHDGHLVKEAFSRTLRTGESTHNEIIQLKGFDGTPQMIFTSVSPLRGLKDEIVGAAAVIQDITEHKRIEQDMEQRILKLISLGVGFEQSSREV